MFQAMNSHYMFLGSNKMASLKDASNTMVSSETATREATTSQIIETKQVK